MTATYTSRLVDALRLHGDDVTAFARRFVDGMQGVEDLYTAGNGGSSSIASHMVVDFVKTCCMADVVSGPKRVTCLMDSTPLLTAMSNDVSYEEALARCYINAVRHLDATRTAVLVVSSSGNSPNVVNLAKIVKLMGGTVHAMVGFTGGELYALADNALHIKSNSYGIVEDCHHATMHAIVEEVKARRGLRSTMYFAKPAHGIKPDDLGDGWNK